MKLCWIVVLVGISIILVFLYSLVAMSSRSERFIEQLMEEEGRKDTDVQDIQNIMRYGRSDIDDEYFAIIKAEIEDFVDKVYNSIREFGYNLKTTRKVTGQSISSRLPISCVRSMVFPL